MMVLIGGAILVGAMLPRPSPPAPIPPERGVFTPTGSPSGPLLNHRATLLADGRVLVTHFDAAEDLGSGHWGICRGGVDAGEA